MKFPLHWARLANWTLISAVSIALLLAADASAWETYNEGTLEIKLTPATREYCHIIRFPQAWAIPRQDKYGQPLFFNYASEYEFRVEGVLSTKFLIGGFTTLVQRYDTLNRYTVDLSDPNVPIVPASRASWEASAVIPLIRKSVFPPSETVPNQKSLDLHGLQFAKSGDIWAQPSDGSSRLSPDQRWLVLQSTEIKSKPSGTRVFFDVFDADTGRKVITFDGTYTSGAFAHDVDGYLASTAWVTERYFVVPLGQHKERCLVCEFGRASKQEGSKQ